MAGRNTGRVSKIRIISGSFGLAYLYLAELTHCKGVIFGVRSSAS